MNKTTTATRIARVQLMNQAETEARDAAVTLVCEMAAPNANIPAEPTAAAWRFFYRNCSKWAAAAFKAEWQSAAAELMGVR